MKKITRREVLKYIGAGAAMTAVPISGCLGSDKIPIGSLLPLSGNLKDFGPPMNNGVKLAVMRVNENNGGVQIEENGEKIKKEIEVIQEDSKTASQAANSALQKLVNVNAVPAFVGAAGSGVSKSIVETSINNEVVQISPSNTSPYFTTLEDNGYYWRTCASDELQAAAMAKYAKKEKGYETASTLYINNSYGQGFSDQFTKWFQDNLGGEVINTVGYSGDASSYSSEVGTIAEGDPDLVVLVGYPEEGSIILSEAYQNGMLEEADWLLSEGLRSGDLADQVGTKEGGGYIAEGMMGTTPDPRAASDAYDDFQQHYDTEFGKAPSTFVPHSYDAASLIMLAMEKAGEASGPAIKNNLMEVANSPGTEVFDLVEGIELLREGEEINFYGSGGMQDFNEVGDVTSTFALWSINSEGKIELGETLPLPQELTPESTTSP
ncbi:amino acid ABC transporter substrate-binding protein [archaeon SCG-AAA382B04]|nr:amino acid ABC transporter substrate-binding protein [archaeon SCG-AAA382B04]